jgi:hypothetical protein
MMKGRWEHGMGHCYLTTKVRPTRDRSPRWHRQQREKREKGGKMTGKLKNCSLKRHCQKCESLKLNIHKNKIKANA